MKNHHIHAITNTIDFGPTRQTPQLTAAKKTLQTCHGRTESMTAIREYLDAKREAHKTPTRGAAPRAEHDTAIPLCAQCGARPLITPEAEQRGYCDQCADARPQPKPDLNGARRNA